MSAHVYHISSPRIHTHSMTGSILEGHRLLVPPKWMDTEGWEWTALLALARTPGGCVSASDRQIEPPLTVYQRFGDAISQTRDGI